MKIAIWLAGIGGVLLVYCGVFTLGYIRGWKMGWQRRGEDVANNAGERICEPSAGSKYAPADGSTSGGQHESR